MQDILLVTQEDLKPYQKVSLPEGWSVFLQKDDETKRRISYEYAVSKEYGTEGIGHVVFDKTDEPRFYKKEGEVVAVEGSHFERSVQIHEAEEGEPRYGAYGITMAGMLKVLEELQKAGIERFVVRTDETNMGALKFNEKIGLKAYPEIVPVSDKHGAITMVETTGRIIDTTVEESIQGLKNFKRDLPLAVLVAYQKGRF